MLPTNTPYLLTSAVETALAGTSGLRGFSDLEWNAETGLVYIVPVNETDRAYAYRIATGQRVDVLAAAGGQVPAEVLPATAPTPARRLCDPSNAAAHHIPRRGKRLVGDLRVAQPE